MRLVLLGTGGPRPDPRRHGPGVLVEVGEARLLFDCGRGAVLQLVRAGVPLAQVNPVFLTHHHFDHISDLADVILTSWLQGRRGLLPVFGPEGTAALVETLVGQVYAKDIRLRSEGEPAIGGWQPVTGEDVGPGTVCDGGMWRVRAEHVVHGQGLGVAELSWVTLGYRVEAAGKAVVISGDTVPCEGLDRLARGADVLVQCCYLASAEITDPHAERLTRFLFASSAEVGKVAARAGVKTLVLTHIREKSRAMMRALEEDVRRDFSGRLIVGEDLMRVDI